MFWPTLRADLPPGPEAIEVEPILVGKEIVVNTENAQPEPTYPVQTHRSLICLDMVKNACSTLVAFFADVSKNGMFN